MKQEKKWPVWMDLRYYDQTSGGIMGYTGSMNNSGMMMDVLYRYKITESSIIRWRVDDKLLDDQGIKTMFLLFEKHRKEIEENYEKRKTSIQETKGIDPGSAAQP